MFPISTCLRRRVIAVITNKDKILSIGVNGACKEDEPCTKLGQCYRKQHNIPHGERYELCKAVHAEVNAVLNLSNRDCGELYLYLFMQDVDTGEMVESPQPCLMCRRFLINALGKYQIESFNDSEMPYTKLSFKGR